MPLYLGKLGPCSWTCFVGAFTDEDVDRFVDELRRMGKEAGPAHVVLDIFHDIPMPNACQRRRVAEAVKDATASGMVSAHAIVSSSQTIRGVLTAINWLVRPQFSERTFPNPELAVDWLQTFNGRIDAVGLLAEISERVQGYRQLQW